MSLTTGQRLGPYEILASIGAGGMGEVYRARDTRLDRDGEIDYLVMEYIEGDSLVDRIRKGPLPIEQVLRYGVQIANAGKILGPIGLVVLIGKGSWPVAAAILCVTNDFIWWIPFTLYLVDAWPRFRESLRSGT